eukprot:Gregarina_sp_Poly_1__4510@NODE_2423_length_2152_cov_115_596163_g1540_i0_p1_GENE_NODE_2423_length_2152_cov_115_596163_g1540_i0NODE_2423_length_2152_cov_115_596163_g1540_i0_p1_ORF_typecomplete_len384_score21_18adh_short/PF00106_25/5_1e35adh_short_C2/PF13561_6/4_7e21KR/PF08659_10/6_4e08Epimerase/PF01370_21/1_4e07Polysacc_synt_2/PF02719_15/0_036Shikimate_DH/PF01488_20/0_0772Hacid_dh_C/PF02826_19/0_22DUF3017/PF11222_8/3DUF3017/PF11222_8/3_4e03_NODE_2423_length_2152_cov_115_596163_g1540_i08782029
MFVLSYAPTRPILHYIRIHVGLPEFQSFVFLVTGVALLIVALLKWHAGLLSLGSVALAMAKYSSGGRWFESKMKRLKLENRTIIILGASRSLGHYTAERLARLGPKKLILGIRGSIRAARIALEIERDAGCATGTVMGIDLNLLSLESVLQFVDIVKKSVSQVDVLFCNAGALAPAEWKSHRLSKDGLEESWQTNIVGHYIVIEELLPRLLQSDLKRIIHMSSIAHSWTMSPINYNRLTRVSVSCAEHNPLQLYAWAKLAQIYHTTDLHERYGSNGLVALAIHPGLVRTDIQARSVSTWINILYRAFILIVGKSVAQGAQTGLYACVADDAVFAAGCWVHDCAPCLPTLLAQNTAERKKCIHWLSEVRRGTTSCGAASAAVMK